MENCLFFCRRTVHKGPDTHCEQQTNQIRARQRLALAIYREGLRDLEGLATNCLGTSRLWLRPLRGDRTKP